MKNQAECWTALLDGQILQGTTSLNCLHLIDGELHWKAGNKAIVTFADPSSWEIYVEPKWYDNIPKCGLLCWVWDGEHDKGKFANIINNYEESDGYPFKTKIDFYENAQPLTKSEIQQWLDAAPE